MYMGQKFLILTVTPKPIRTIDNSPNVVFVLNFWLAVTAAPICDLRSNISVFENDSVTSHEVVRYNERRMKRLIVDLSRRQSPRRFPTITVYTNRCAELFQLPLLRQVDYDLTSFNVFPFRNIRRKESLFRFRVRKQLTSKTLQPRDCRDLWDSLVSIQECQLRRLETIGITRRLVGRLAYMISAGSRRQLFSAALSISQHGLTGKVLPAQLYWLEVNAC